MKNGHSIAYESRQAARLAMKIDGQIRETEAAYLYKLARRKGNLVEIGCLFGRSTSALVQGASVFGAEVTSVDPFYKTPNTDKLSSPEIWRSNLKSQGFEPPELLVMTSHEAATIYDKEISFLFVDGGHSYADVRQDIADWLPKIKVSGYIAFHDMFMPHIKGVTRAVTEWWLSVFDIKNTTWKYEQMVDFMIAFRRVA